MVHCSRTAFRNYTLSPMVIESALVSGVQRYYKDLRSFICSTNVLLESMWPGHREPPRATKRFRARPLYPISCACETMVNLLLSIQLQYSKRCDGEFVIPTSERQAG